METRRASTRIGNTTRAAAIVAQEVICCIMSSNEDNHGNLVINDESTQSSNHSRSSQSRSSSRNSNYSSNDIGDTVLNTTGSISTSSGNPLTANSSSQTYGKKSTNGVNVVKPLKIGIKRGESAANSSNGRSSTHVATKPAKKCKSSSVAETGRGSPSSSSSTTPSPLPSSTSSPSPSPTSPGVLPHHHHHHQRQDAADDEAGNGVGIGKKSRSMVVNTVHQYQNHHRATFEMDSMYDAYQIWASKTYGDSAKTKTVTRKKYSRIVKILRGEETTSVENSKFRFWVKAKGFKLGPSDTKGQSGGGQQGGQLEVEEEEEDEILYVPCPKAVTIASKINGSKSNEMVYKKVAVVENFYAIIYDVHVEMDGRSGKHAGQKRTYRAVAEMYAFLPREAVTRFLMSCSDCQKRMHLQGISSSTGNGHHMIPTHLAGSTGAKKSNSSAGGKKGKLTKSHKNGMSEEPDLEYSLPITTTYLKRMKSLGYNGYTDETFSGGSTIPELCGELSIAEDLMENETNMASEMASNQSGAEDGLETDTEDAIGSNCQEYEIIAADGDEEDGEAEGAEDDDEEEDTYNDENSRHKLFSQAIDMSKVKSERPEECRDEPLNMTSGRIFEVAASKRKSSDAVGKSSKHDKVPKRNASADVYTSSLRNGKVKDEEDEEEDDDECDADVQEAEQQDRNSYDPERLKAFNMFVRLFVDENLDRMVPISRQPKEKIQAIIDSCARQFPEFGERSRKRIRTYLKSCRRTRRHKSALAEKEGIKCESKTVPPTITASTYHLSSPLAEQILANACENECKNARRMRLGLKPLCANSLQENENSSSTNSTTLSNSVPASSSAVQVLKPNSTTSSNSILVAFANQVKSEEKSKPDSLSNLASCSQKPQDACNSMLSSHLSSNISSNNLNSNTNTNGNSSGTSGTGTSVPPRFSLNPSEMAAVKQLIAGYRESAAFLLRSADELEHLLLQQT